MSKKHNQNKDVNFRLITPMDQLLTLLSKDTQRKKQLISGCATEMEHFLANENALEEPCCILPGYGRFISLPPEEAGWGESYELFMTKNHRGENCFLLCTLPKEKEEEKGAAIYYLRRRKERWQTYDGQGGWFWVEFDAPFEYEGEALEELLEENGAPFSQVYRDIETSMDMASVTAFLVRSAIHQVIPRLTKVLGKVADLDSFSFDARVFCTRVFSYSIFDTNDFLLGSLVGDEGETIEIGFLSKVEGEDLKEEVTPYYQTRSAQGEFQRQELESFVVDISSEE